MKLNKKTNEEIVDVFDDIDIDAYSDAVSTYYIDDNYDTKVKGGGAAGIVAAGVAVAAPIAGIALANGVVAGAAELPQADTVHTVSAETPQAAASEDASAEQKVVNFKLSGPGYIEAADNCVIDNETGEIRFLDADQNAAFSVVTGTDDAESRITAGDYQMSEGTDYVILEAHGNYGLVNIEFAGAPATNDAISIGEATDFAGDEGFAVDTNANDDFNAVQEAAPAVVEEAAPASTAPSAPAAQPAAPQKTTRVVTRTVTKTTTPAPSQSATSTSTQHKTSSTPYSGAAQHGMNSEEQALARQIFDKYNDYRASKGLSRVAWSDDCANMAFGSSIGCAAQESRDGTPKLTHRLGIPTAVQNNYSDILQFSSWKMDPTSIVDRWINSDGHRKMMQCNTSEVAGVGVYNNGGFWYYTIVYNFQGTNVNGS